MKRLMYNSKTCQFEFRDFHPELVDDYGVSCVLINKSVPQKVMINNQEVQTGNSRTALYTLPNGEDNGVRYSPMYEFMGADVTELEANKRALQQAKNEVSEKLREEVSKEVEALKEATKVENVAKTNDSSGSSASE